MDAPRFPQTPDTGDSPLVPSTGRTGTEMPDSPEPHGQEAPSVHAASSPEAAALAELENMLQDIRQELPQSPSLPRPQTTAQPPDQPQPSPDLLAELKSVLADIQHELPPTRTRPLASSPPSATRPSLPQTTRNQDSVREPSSQDVSSTLRELGNILTELTGRQPDQTEPAAPTAFVPRHDTVAALQSDPRRRARAASGGPANPAPFSALEPEEPSARSWGNGHPRPPRSGVLPPVFPGPDPLSGEQLLLPPDLLDFEPGEQASGIPPDVPPVPELMELPPEISWDSLWGERLTEDRAIPLPDNVSLRSFIPPEDLENPTESLGTPADLVPEGTEDLPFVDMPQVQPAPIPPASALAAPVPNASLRAPSAVAPTGRQRAERKEARDQARKERHERQAEHATARASRGPDIAPPARRTEKHAEDQAALDSLAELRKLLSGIAPPPSSRPVAGGRAAPGPGKGLPQTPASPWRQLARRPAPVPAAHAAASEARLSRRTATPPSGPPIRQGTAPAWPSARASAPFSPEPADISSLLPLPDLAEQTERAAPPAGPALTGPVQPLNQAFHARQQAEPENDAPSVLLPLPGGERDQTAAESAASPGDALPDAAQNSPDISQDRPLAAVPTPVRAADPALPPEPAGSSPAAPAPASASPRANAPDTPDAGLASQPEPEAAAPGDSASHPAEPEKSPGWLGRLGRQLRRVFHRTAPDEGNGRKADALPPLPPTDNATAAPLPDGAETAAPAPGGLMQRLRDMEAEHRERLRVLSERPRGPVYPSAEARRHLLQFSLAASEPGPARRSRLTDESFARVAGSGPINLLRDKPTAWERLFRSLRARLSAGWRAAPRDKAFRGNLRKTAGSVAFLAVLGSALYAATHREQLDQTVQFLLNLLP